jgi:uncharacterized protein involved in response to NO
MPTLDPRLAPRLAPRLGNMIQITDRQQALKTLPILRLGFRPFFLGGTIFSVLSLFIWLLMYRGSVNFSPLGGPYWWHIHEMIFGFSAAIICGFLLTAVQNWTGMQGLQGKPLFLLLLLWCSGRLLMLFPDLLPIHEGAMISIFIDLSFFPIVAVILGKPIVAAKQYRNLFVIPLLSLFTLANAEMHLAVWYPDTFHWRYSGFSAVMLVTFLISVMAGRVTPMFTANGTKTAKVASLKWLEISANGSLAIASFTLLLHPLIGFSPTFFGPLLIIAGLFQGMRWLRWRPWITVNTPLLWSLHGAVKFIWVALVLLGVSYLVEEIQSNHVWHLLTIGGIGGLILTMMTRVTLGHTGRPLMPPKFISLAFSLIFVAALIRAIGPWAFAQHTNLFIDLSGLCWLIGYSIFIVKVGPMLTKARIDGGPG